ncbi:MAG: FeoB-associated Cys-rich membrane protein [Salinivirgaceae bacterium]|nr:FeoB-associated Cys-rich membrane protein [Salinivirgaceae bacterium]
MLQNIITWVVIAVAVIYFAKRIYDRTRGNGGSCNCGCGGCSCNGKDNNTCPNCMQQ